MYVLSLTPYVLTRATPYVLTRSFLPASTAMAQLGFIIHSLACLLVLRHSESRLGWGIWGMTRPSVGLGDTIVPFVPLAN